MTPFSSATEVLHVDNKFGLTESGGGHASMTIFAFTDFAYWA